MKTIDEKINKLMTQHGFKEVIAAIQRISYHRYEMAEEQRATRASEVYGIVSDNLGEALRKIEEVQRVYAGMSKPFSK